jgi:Peptidase A4 family
VGWQVRARQIVLRLVGTAAVAAAVLAAGVSAAQARSPFGAPKHKFGRGTSTNWSGYAVDGSGATQVIGTWTQPAVTCSAGENSWSSPWVGIDGDASNTVEQIGTDSDCQSGKPVYYAWYEMYPKSLVQLTMAVHPGDSFTGTVKYTSGSSFALTLTDNTTKATFTTTQSARKAARSSVEWIMEGPSNGLLSDFGSVSFSAASATIGGQTGGLSSFPGAQAITMVTNSGVVRAQPSAVSGNAFSVAWKHG